MSAVIELTETELTRNEVLYGISWEEYERLIQKYWGFQSPKLTYNRGILEIEMSNSDELPFLSRNMLC